MPLIGNDTTQSCGIRAIIGLSPKTSQVSFHLCDRLRNGVSIIAPCGLQISSPNEFGDHLTGSYPEEGLNDVIHGSKFK